MIISSHLCLLTDGSYGHFPLVVLNDNGLITSLRLFPDGLPEVGGMRFVPGILLANVPANIHGVSSSSRLDFARQMSPFALAIGRSHLCAMQGVDLNSFRGSFSKLSIL